MHGASTVNCLSVGQTLLCRILKHYVGIAALLLGATWLLVSVAAARLDAPDDALLPLSGCNNGLWGLRSHDTETMHSASTVSVLDKHMNTKVWKLVHKISIGKNF